MVRDLTELTVGSHDFRFDPPLREHVICQVAVRRQIAGWWKDAKFVRCIHALSVEGSKQTKRAYDFDVDLSVPVRELP